MNINGIKTTSYARSETELDIYLAQPQTQDTVEAAFLNAETVRVYTDNEPQQQLAADLGQYPYIRSFDGTRLVLSRTAPAVEYYKQRKLDEIDAYDHSTEEFTMQGDTLWLDWGKREQLRSRLDNEEAQGLTDTTLWNGATAYTLPIAQARQILAAVEAYAIKTYDQTAWHKSNVLALDTAEAVEQYDHTTGYPEKLEF